MASSFTNNEPEDGIMPAQHTKCDRSVEKIPYQYRSNVLVTTKGCLLLAFGLWLTTANLLAVQVYWADDEMHPGRILVANTVSPNSQQVIVHSDDFFPAQFTTPFYGLTVNDAPGGGKALYFGGGLPNSPNQRRLYRTDLTGETFNQISNLEVPVDKLEVDFVRESYYWIRGDDLRRISFNGDVATIDRPPSNNPVVFQGFDINFEDEIFYFGQNSDNVASGIQFVPLSEFDNPSPTTQTLITLDEILGVETRLDVNWLQVDTTLGVVFFTSELGNSSALFRVNEDGTDGKLVGETPLLGQFKLSPTENRIYYKPSGDDPWLDNTKIKAIDYLGNPIDFELVSDVFIRDFEIASVQSPTITSYSWAKTEGGFWSGGDWDITGFPDGNTVTVVFGDILNVPGTVVTDVNRTVKTITFDSEQPYNVAGHGKLFLEAEVGSSKINVIQGDHQFQLVAEINSNTTVNIAAVSSLSFNNALNLNGNILTKTGAGTIAINNLLSTNRGTINLVEGTIIGGGQIGGNLHNVGTVSPGGSSGMLISSIVPEPSTWMLLIIGILLGVTTTGMAPKSRCG